MSPEKDKYLVEKYPSLYADRYASAQDTAMCWGFEVDDGWFDLIDRLSEKITEIAKTLDYEVKAVQVKEKFGTLRFYTNVGSPEIWDAIDAAEIESEKICEICGNPGKVRNRAWLKTLCDEHDG